jgi:hypothetical protein
MTNASMHHLSGFNGAFKVIAAQNLFKTCSRFSSLSTTLSFAAAKMVAGQPTFFCKPFS